ncbi:hypothetical protein ARTSIC4J27_608 [Pseudarthrobacter siccitolerans]|uniref:Uncharacterized protein n=2 Tax=Pseudarthrobacter siccitolerans TaxID=861266 RepID=A0A024GYV9_9MICC|nr:hypothetical protein ARTSIC4J27_608 [Pseudarthrobacter siccitolerans]
MLDQVLGRLGEATPETQPFSDPDLGAAFVQVAQGILAFVQAARKPGGPGYEEAREGLVGLVAFLPPEEEDGLPNMIHKVQMGL